VVDKKTERTRQNARQPPRRHNKKTEKINFFSGCHQAVDTIKIFIKLKIIATNKTNT
jgi:hypothetical protein